MLVLSYQEDAPCSCPIHIEGKFLKPHPIDTAGTGTRQSSAAGLPIAQQRQQ